MVNDDITRHGMLYYDWIDYVLVNQELIALSWHYFCTGDDSISIRWASVAWIQTWHVTRRGESAVMGLPWALMGHGFSEEMDFHPRTCPQSWRGGSLGADANRLTKR